MKITKLGHCSMVIEEDGIRILTDPGNYSTAQNEQKNIDIILITHEHQDHLHIESLKKVAENNPQARIITNESVGSILRKDDFPFITIDDGKKTEEMGILIEGFGKKHAEIFKDFSMVENTSYLINERFFYPGDAFYNPNRPVEILALPVAGPWCKISDAVNYALSIKPKECFPVHDGGLRITGGHHKVPELILGENGINFTVFELGKEYSF